MTLTELLSFANYGLVLLYGVFLSVWFSGGFHSKRDRAVLFILYGFVLLLQAICWEVLGLEETRKLYPFLSHLPLWLTLTWAMKRPAGDLVGQRLDGVFLLSAAPLGGDAVSGDFPEGAGL